eukprot:CAMPEP_0171462642 /NCGR_PEP_ID=MMETSP0945-20130129/6593_1 /TAXON_ID=109269 /ORGANISM="Vaucheria litorea, Strain CCMP2940" /LENGTH=195 /DNA_ID=CAMNT_0011989199 /DNA_START=212 /DNA_END=799 /DNA_ORIENTATION=-
MMMGANNSFLQDSKKAWEEQKEKNAQLRAEIENQKSGNINSAFEPAVHSSGEASVDESDAAIESLQANEDLIKSKNFFKSPKPFIFGIGFVAAVKLAMVVCQRLKTHLDNRKISTKESVQDEGESAKTMQFDNMSDKGGNDNPSPIEANIDEVDTEEAITSETPDEVEEEAKDPESTDEFKVSDLTKDKIDSSMI